MMGSNFKNIKSDKISYGIRDFDMYLLEDKLVFPLAKLHRVSNEIGEDIKSKLH